VKGSKDWLPDPDNPGEQARVHHIYSRGWPEDTDEEHAVDETRLSAVEFTGGRILLVEREQTDAHRDAGEYLITVYLTDVPDFEVPPDRPGDGAEA
jgi:hypothetical protein